MTRSFLASQTNASTHLNQIDIVSPLAIDSIGQSIEQMNVTPLRSFATEAPQWTAMWGQRRCSGTLTDCLNFMGIYGSARDFHMREASRTGQTGGDIWSVQWSSDRDSVWSRQVS